MLLLASIAGTTWVIFFEGADYLQKLVTHAVGIAQSSDGEHRLTMLAIYSLVCLITQLIVVPSGSMILMVSGFVFGPVIAAGIFSLAQVLALWPVYKVATVSLQSEQTGWLHRLQQSLLSHPILKALKQEGVVAGIVLRLTPVIPSAAACCFAAALKIPIGAFVVATLLVCWVRPLFFASIGGAIQELSSLQSTIGAGASINLWPIILVFIASVLLLLARLWLKRQ